MKAWMRSSLEARQRFVVFFCFSLSLSRSLSLSLSLSLVDLFRLPLAAAAKLISDCTAFTTEAIIAPGHDGAVPQDFSKSCLNVLQSLQPILNGTAVKTATRVAPGDGGATPGIAAKSGEVAQICCNLLRILRLKPTWPMALLTYVSTRF